MKTDKYPNFEKEYVEFIEKVTFDQMVKMNRKDKANAVVARMKSI